MQSSLRRPVLNKLIRDYVKQYILDHGLGAGDPLPSETQLAQELGVGRGSVREAIKALQSLGIIEVRHGDGLYVRSYTFDPILETLSYGMRFDATTLSELAQIRVFLERGAIEDAVKQVHTADLDRLEDLMTLWKGRVEAQEYPRDIDEEFHRILYGTLNNETLMKLFELFWIAFDNLQDPVIQDARPAKHDYENHRALLDAIKDRDPDLARELMVSHFGHLRQRIDQAMAYLRNDENGNE
jgi:DNA-binding FadR family transcriptional regulator